MKQQENKKLKGVTVPNTGMVNKIYFNSDLTPQEIIELLKPFFEVITDVTLDVDRYYKIYPVFCGVDDTGAISGILHIWQDVETYDLDIIYDDYKTDENLHLLTKDGWLKKSITVNAIARSVQDGMRVGDRNIGLSSIISIDPFIELDTTDVFTSCAKAIRQKNKQSGLISPLVMPDLIQHTKPVQTIYAYSANNILDETRLPSTEPTAIVNISLDKGKYGTRSSIVGLTISGYLLTYNVGNLFTPIQIEYSKNVTIDLDKINAIYHGLAQAMSYTFFEIINMAASYGIALAVDVDMAAQNVVVFLPEPLGVESGAQINDGVILEFDQPVYYKHTMCARGMPSVCGNYTCGVPWFIDELPSVDFLCLPCVNLD